jgi:hypothetical protein
VRSSQQPTADSAAEPRGQRRRLLSEAEAAVTNPILAYGAILAIQLRVIWNVWRYKDLTFGDTSSYFLDAVSWARGLHDNIVWSPLYTSFWGTILALVGDVYAAAMVHRVAIVLATTLLVLGLMRSLLGPALGFLVTVWWAILPSNWNVLYEVHLFGVLPVLAAALVVARAPGRSRLGVALGILAGATLLLRNELIIATTILAVAVVVWEFRRRRDEKAPALRYARAYGVPLAIVCLLATGAYARSHVQGHEILPALRAKHNLNVCQVYAFNFQQRHPDRFPGNPFIDCAPLMKQAFGRPMPSLVQATTANPRAIAEFVAWNLRLLPSGLQVALFGATVTGDNPDYVPVEEHRSYALALSVIVVAVVIAGIAMLIRDRKFWRHELASRAWALIVLSAAAITALVVALSQRPRPEYLYGLTFSLLALIGLCSWALLRRLGGLSLVAPLVVGLTVILCVALPTHYHRGPRPIHDAVERLQVIREPLQQRGSVLATSGYGFEICAYLAERFDRLCTPQSWTTLKARAVGSKSIGDVLDEAGVTAIYADPSLQADPVLASLRPAGWKEVARGSAPEGPWSILLRHN